MPTSLLQPFSENEQKEIFRLVEKIVGTEKIAQEKPHIFLNNVQRRILKTNKKNLKEYLQYLKSDAKEHEKFISAITIHTTYWFREPRHFHFMEHQLACGRWKGKKLRVMSMGCSEGEEVYTLALILESYRQTDNDFDYTVEGYDVDPISVQKAAQAVYSESNLQKIPKKYHHHILVGSGKTKGLLTLSKDIRSRCKFYVKNALQTHMIENNKYNLIFCRNMLIYFTENQVNRIIRDLVDKLHTEGVLCIGHSENIPYDEVSIRRLEGSVYIKDKPKHSPVSRATAVPLAHLSATSSILIITDCETTQRVIESSLKLQRFQCFMISDLEQAENIIQKNKIEIIILGMQNKED